MKIYASHHLPCTPETYWRLYFDEAYNRALDREIELAEHVVLVDELRDGKRYVRARITPKREVPRAVQRVVKSATLGYEEERLYDADRSLIEWNAIHPTLGKRLVSKGRFTISPEGDGCRRVLDGMVEVKILGVGKLIEKGIASDVERTYDVSSRFITRWLEEHPA